MRKVILTLLALAMALSLATFASAGFCSCTTIGNQTFCQCRP